MRNYQTIKWLFVFIVLMAINTFNAMGQTTVVFDFTSAEWLKSVGITPPGKGAGTNITSKTILYEGITMTSTKGTENARIWNSSGKYDFRIYKNGGTVTFKASQGYNITEIVFTGTIKLSEIKDKKIWNGNANSVTFTASETNQIKTATITYISSGEIIKQPANLSFSPTQLNLETGQTEVIEFAKATTADVTFTNSNESVATYDAATSTITAIAPGTTTITATSEANEQYEEGNATLVVTVKNPVKPANLSFSPTEIELGVGATQVVEFTKSTTADVTFTSSNESVATYDASTSTITAIGIGTATITAASQENGEYSAGSATLTVNVVKTFDGDSIFYESFDKNDGTGGNSGGWSGSIASSNDVNFDNEGWENKNAYKADKCLRLGATKTQGSATTPSIGYAGTVKLSFKAGAWNITAEKTTIEISVSGGGEIIGNTTIELVKGAFTDYTFPINGLTADSKITFSAIVASNNRFFLDEVLVEKLHVELNETSATAPEEKTITDVTLNRTFNADRWNPVCLPFAITAEQITEWFGKDSEVAEYIGDEESNGNVTVKFRKKTDGMNANTPYLLFPKKNVTVSKFPAVEIITTDMPKSEGTIFDFVGTYTNQPKGSSEIQMGDYIVSGGIFKKASGGNAIKAFRAYLRQRNVSNAKTVSMLFEDETTGISELKDNALMPTIYYDLQGRRVAAPSKGIYIVNGKKVIIK